jgi:hypothetical protein
MRTLFWRWAVVVLLVIVPMGLSAHAQEGGLSAEQQDLLERVLSARENYRAYTSLVEDVMGGQSRELVLTLGSNQQSRSTLITWERSAQIIREEAGRNITATATASITDSGTGVGGEVNSRTRTLNVDFRLVDGQIYLQAAYGADTAPDPELPVLPEGWFEVESLQDWPVLEDLQLQDLVEPGNVFDDFDNVRAAVSDVTVAPATLEDGTPVEAITLTFDVAGMRLLYASQGPANSVMQQILANLTEDSGASLTVIVDADNNPYEASSDEVLHATGLDPSAFGMDQIPAGAGLEFTNEFTRHEAYSQVNESFEPAVAPEAITG